MAKRLSRASDSTADLVLKVRRGDRAAANEVAERELPKLRRWARGKLPSYARGMRDTEDLVQDAMLRTFMRINDVDVSRPGGLQAYVRQAFRNSVIDNVRQAERRPRGEELVEIADSRPSPDTEAADREAAARFWAACAQLTPVDRRLIEARFERDWDYEKIARILRKPTANAARVAVRRACQRLVEQLNGLQP